MNRKDLPKPNANCEVCGKAYYRCTRCIELKGKGIDTWKLHCDIKPCYEKLFAVTMAEKDMIDSEEFCSIMNNKLPEDREYTEEFSSKVNALTMIYGYVPSNAILVNETIKDETIEDSNEVENNFEQQDEEEPVVDSNSTLHKQKKVRHRAIKNVK